MSETIELAKALISKDSITPEDKGCQLMMIERLEKLGFRIHSLPFGDVENFWATHGSSSPVIAFAGHTDVVPAGDVGKWQTNPFEPTIKNGLLYGRGAADMKGSLASMVIAVEQFVQDNPSHPGTIGFLITSDEEGPAADGTVKVVEYLQQNHQKVDYCLVGEPSSTDTLGDVIKNGRRGSLNACLTIHGKQGHIAYPQLAKNPIHLAAPALNALCDEAWDKGNAHFPATSFQVSNINSGTGVTNVIPGEIDILFNFRYSTETTQEKIKARVLEILDTHSLDYEVKWHHSGPPFLTESGVLVSACVNAIKAINGVDAKLSTSGGTSDGRFISQMGTQVVELGPLNATIHQIDECVSVEDLENLTHIYRQVLTNILV